MVCFTFRTPERHVTMQQELPLVMSRLWLCSVWYVCIYVCMHHQELWNACCCATAVDSAQQCMMHRDSKGPSEVFDTGASEQVCMTECQHAMDD